MNEKANWNPRTLARMSFTLARMQYALDTSEFSSYMYAYNYWPRVK